MTRAVDFLPRAEREVEAAYSWYESQRVGLGAEFLLALDSVASHVARNPEAFPRVGALTRRAVMRRFPYLVFFVDEGDRVLIVGVFDGRRHPPVWGDRVREAIGSSLENRRSPYSNSVSNSASSSF